MLVVYYVSSLTFHHAIFYWSLSLNSMTGIPQIYMSVHLTDTIKVTHPEISKNGTWKKHGKKNTIILVVQNTLTGDSVTQTLFYTYRLAVHRYTCSIAINDVKDKPQPQISLWTCEQNHDNTLFKTGTSWCTCRQKQTSLLNHIHVVIRYNN